MSRLDEMAIASAERLQRLSEQMALEIERTIDILDRMRPKDEELFTCDVEPPTDEELDAMSPADLWHYENEVGM